MDRPAFKITKDSPGSDAAAEYAAAMAVGSIVFAEKGRIFFLLFCNCDELQGIKLPTLHSFGTELFAYYILSQDRRRDITDVHIFFNLVTLI